MTIDNDIERKQSSQGKGALWLQRVLFLALLAITLTSGLWLVSGGPGPLQAETASQPVRVHHASWGVLVGRW